jgi:hypothetical protein
VSALQEDPLTDVPADDERVILEPHEIDENTPPTALVRTKNGAIMPVGMRSPLAKQSSKPKGLAKRIREMVGDDPGRIANILFDILEDPRAANRDRIAAGKELLDRGWGKAPTFMPIEGGDPLERSELDQAIRDIADQLVARSKHPVLDAQMIRREIEEGIREP